MVKDSIETTCPYCGVGCGVTAEVENNRLIAVSGSRHHPANHGRLCVKGAALHETMGEHGRLLYPQLDGRRVSWDKAIAGIASRLKTIRETHGPQAIAFYLSGQLLTEDYYIVNKFAKGFIGTGNVDTNSRLCMSSAVAGYKRAFGADTVPCNYQDLESCDLLILVGSNAAWTHPVLYRRMAAAKQDNPAMKVVVIDPRRTATCDLADLHLAIAPGSDAYVFNGLLSYLADRQALNQPYIDRHTEGFGDALSAARRLDFNELLSRTKVSQEDLLTFYQWVAATEKTITFYSQGINQSATGADKCNAIINCHLATGRIGRKGMGPFSITGQPNAMGGREVGGLANQLAAHMDYSPNNIDTLRAFWESDSVSGQAGLKAVDLFDAVATGEIKAIWIMCTNPVVSMPDAGKVKAALEQCETVIVSDCIADTDTTATANILLPATGWGEKSGTVTNSERRISRQRSFLKAPGEALHDWQIVSRVADKMGFADSFNYRSPRDIFIEHAALSGFRNQGERLFNISALSNLSEREYHELAPVQWPVTGENPQGTARLFNDNQFVTANGKARFVALQPQIPKQELCDTYPLTLNTGRIRDQWHSMTRTARSARLLNHIDEPFVLVHPDTADNNNLADGELADVTTARGTVRVITKIDSSMAEDQLFIPIHWSDQHSGNAKVDALIAPITDPISGQPEFKFTPARIASVTGYLWARIVSRKALDCGSFLYWTRAPLLAPRGSIDGFSYWVAVSESFDWQRFVETQQLPESSCAHYADPQLKDARFIYYRQDGIHLAVFCRSQKAALPSSQWLAALLGEKPSASPWRLLSGKDLQQTEQGKLICSCHEVGEKQITDAIIAGQHSVQALGKTLKCGTNCGSCIPELNQLLAAVEKENVA